MQYFEKQLLMNKSILSPCRNSEGYFLLNKYRNLDELQTPHIAAHQDPEYIHYSCNSRFIVFIMVMPRLILPILFILWRWRTSIVVSFHRLIYNSADGGKDWWKGFMFAYLVHWTEDIASIYDYIVQRGMGNKVGSYYNNSANSRA